MILCYSQSLLCFQHTAFLLPHLQQSRTLRSRLSKAHEGPHRDQEHPQKRSLLKRGTTPALCRIRPRLPKHFLLRDAQPVPCQRPAPTHWSIDPLLLRPFQNPIPSLQRFCLPSDQIYEGYPWTWLQEKNKSFCCSAASGTKTAKCSLHTWSYLKGYEQDTQTDRQLCSRTRGGSVDPCQPDNGVSFNKHRFECGNQIWNSRSQHCLHSWSGTELAERKELRHWPRHAPAVCDYLFPPPLNATIQLVFISL